MLKPEVEEQPPEDTESEANWIEDDVMLPVPGDDQLHFDLDGSLCISDELEPGEELDLPGQREQILPAEAKAPAKSIGAGRRSQKGE